MTRLRDWFTNAKSLLVVALLASGFAAPIALAGPDHSRGFDYDRDDHRHSRLERVMADRDAAWRKVEQLQRELAARPSAGQWAEARDRIAGLEQQLEHRRGYGRHHFERRVVELERRLSDRQAQLVAVEAQLTETRRSAHHRQRRIERLQHELEESRTRVARLERRLGYSRYRHGWRAGLRAPVVVLDD